MVLTQARLKEVLEYNSETGDFIWKVNQNLHLVGCLAGAFNSRDYIIIQVDGGRYLAHRLAWLYMTGNWPDRIDHVDRDVTNNKWCNLRECSQSQNMMNKIPGLGIEKHGKKWRARIKLDGQKIELGSFYTPEEAREAYLVGRANYFGEFCG